MSGGNFLQFIAAVMAMVTQTHRYAKEGILAGSFPMDTVLGNQIKPRFGDISQNCGILFRKYIENVKSIAVG